MRQNPRILVAEDDEPLREIMVRRLQRSGFEVVTAADGREAVQVTLETSPDLILMDLSMPAIDGWEALEWIRSNPRVSETPVIALTAYQVDDLGQAATDAGFDAYEQKPVEHDHLVETIWSRLGREPPGR